MNDDNNSLYRHNTQNPGKVFEKEIKDSIPEDVMYFRIKDHAQSFGHSSATRFTPHNECDAFIYKEPRLIALELKSTKHKSLTFSTERNDKQIKACQIAGLTNLSHFQGITAGFLFNFRDEPVTYFMTIHSFNSFMEQTDKKSININDIKQFGGMVIPQTKKRVHYKYDLSLFWEEK